MGRVGETVWMPCPQTRTHQDAGRRGGAARRGATPWTCPGVDPCRVQRHRLAGTAAAAGAATRVQMGMLQARIGARRGSARCGTARGGAARSGAVHGAPPDTRPTAARAARGVAAGLLPCLAAPARGWRGGAWRGREGADQSEEEGAPAPTAHTTRRIATARPPPPQAWVATDNATHKCAQRHGRETRAAGWLHAWVESI